MDSTPADTNNVENEIDISEVIQDHTVVPENMIKDVGENEEEQKGDSMEGLRVDDDDEDVEQSLVPEEEKKDTSGEEDLLGAQRLIMSDSDDEEVAVEEEVKVELRKRSKRILDSDEEDQQSLNKYYSDTQKYPKDWKQPNCSNSEADNIVQSTNSQSHVNSDIQQDHSMFLKTKSKFNGLVDSDSEDEVTAKNSNSEVDSGSDIENPDEQNKSKHKARKISALVDTDSSSDSDQSQQEESQYSGGEAHNENENHGVQEKKKPKQMRASAKKAMDDMQALQSEQQRLHREAHISVPYHKPKRHTLQEFLKRRTIQKPIQSSREGSPAGVLKPFKSLKMSVEEMEEYAKLMEARAKEATEFFKSESEDDEPKNNTVMEKSPSPPKVPMEEKETKGETDQFLNTETETELADFLSSTDMHLDLSIEAKVTSVVDVDVLASQPIITEVVELPKLNVNTLKIAPPTTTETIFKLIHDKQLPDSPSLKGDPNMMIDLDTGDLVAKESTGVDNLLRRFMAAKARRKPKTSETISILSTENGKLEMSKVNIHITDDSDQNKESKPGEAYFKLQENLRSIIKKKRLDDLEKKKAEKREEEMEHNKCFDDDEDELADDEAEYDYKTNSKKKNKASDALMIDDEENTINIEEDDETDVEDDNEENLDYEALQNIDKIVKKTEHVEGSEEIGDDVDTNVGVEENEGEDDDYDDDEDNDDEDEDEDSDENNEQGSQTKDNLKRKSRIIKAFQPDSDEEIDFLRTPTQLKMNADKLFDEHTAKINPTNDENELLELCSGKFEDTMPSIISQIPITQANTSAATADDELMELCSGNFEEIPDNTPTQITATPATNVPKCSHKIVSSDDENTLNTNNETEPKRLKKLTKRAKNNKVKLGFSDDEDDEETAAAVPVSADEESLDAADIEDVPETFIDYDSEENEIVVEMTKKECVKQAENFFEKEAELSESEWGSADEDENNLNKYDVELGDEDEFDKAKLQAELGQIHARKMLDEDIREVRKIQEMLFEDEEKDGVGRQRQFKWKNVESGFSLDDPNGEKNALGENGESGDEENEQLWRKIRYEREQLLKDQNLKEGISVASIINSTLSTTTSVGNTTLSTSSVKKLNIISAKKIQSTETKKSSPFLISKSMNAHQKKPTRGSFLIRDKETLSKLAGLTKGGTMDANGTAGTVAVKAAKSQNFVFATLTEEEHASLKRKSDDLLNSSAENGINYMKKSKVEPRREKCFIDQLL